MTSILALPPGLDPLAVDAVFCDLDGTLVDHAELRPASAGAVAELTATGVQVFVATGRMFTSARRFSRLLGLHGLVIAYQGAWVGDATTGACLLHRPLDGTTAAELIRAVQARGFEILAYRHDEPYAQLRSTFTDQYTTSAGVPLNVVDDLAGWATGGAVTKLVAPGEPAACDALRDELVPVFGDRAFIAKSLPYYLEMAAPNVSKEAGVRFVCERLGIDRARTVAVGDGENDRELLQAAGFGIAVAGGFAGLAEDADWVCPPLEEDGAARTLQALASARR